MFLRVKRVGDVELPKFDHPDDSGLTLYAAEDVELVPFTSTLIKNGICLELADHVAGGRLRQHAVAYDDAPDLGAEIQIRPRSSTLAKRNIHVQFGTVDYGYRGELMTCVMYIPKPTLFTLPSGEKFYGFDPTPAYIKKGERLSQLVVCPILDSYNLDVREADELSETGRGAGGFGSTGS